MEGKDLGFLYFPFIYRPSPVAPHHADSTQQMDISQALMGLLSSQPSQFFLTGADEHKHQDAIRMAPNYCVPEQLPCHQGGADPAFSCNDALLAEEAFKQVPLPLAYILLSTVRLSTVLTCKLTNRP